MKSYMGMTAAAAVLIAGGVFMTSGIVSDRGHAPVSSITETLSRDTLSGETLSREADEQEDGLSGAQLYESQAYITIDEHGSLTMKNYEDMLIYTGETAGNIYDRPQEDAGVTGKVPRWAAVERITEDNQEGTVYLEEVPDGWYRIRFDFCGPEGFIRADGDWLEGEEARKTAAEHSELYVVNPDGRYNIYAQRSEEEEPYDTLDIGWGLEVDRTNDPAWYRLHYQETEDVYIRADETALALECPETAYLWLGDDTWGEERTGLVRSAMELAESSRNDPYELAESANTLYFIAEVFSRYGMYDNRVELQRELDRRLQGGHYTQGSAEELDLKPGDIAVYKPQRRGPLWEEHNPDSSDVYPVVGLCISAGLVLRYDGNYITCEWRDWWAGEPVGKIELFK